MDHFAGLDVSVKETSVCIVDDTGRIVREVKVASEPEALLPVLKNLTAFCTSVIERLLHLRGLVRSDAEQMHRTHIQSRSGKRACTCQMQITTRQAPQIVQRLTASFCRKL